MTPETATRVATISITVETQEPGGRIDRVTGFKSSDVSDINLWGATGGFLGDREAVVAGISFGVAVFNGAYVAVGAKVTQDRWVFPRG